MIIRIFKAIIPEELHGEFEMKFKEISVPAVENYNGLISLEIAKPTKWYPNEFIMISRWDKEEDLIEFAGHNWNKAHIPTGMGIYIDSCSVDHYHEIELPKF
ncbi:antibiotic biosynthesis monooxygenase family protein [Maribacter sp. 2307UL18-2]|uniref:antibiotic biosynthesis monooxygenase family protein n=1 Tax=Maribacter sp. 2307UL18-2 TaxID=3386274 RepID=UPI0039BD77EE